MKFNQKRPNYFRTTDRIFELCDFLNHSYQHNGAVRNMGPFGNFHTWDPGTFWGNNNLFTKSDDKV